MTLQELSQDTFYKMNEYSQFVIDLVDTIESDIEEMSQYEKQAQVYLIENVIVITDKEREKDIKAMKNLIEILESNGN